MDLLYRLLDWLILEEITASEVILNSLIAVVGVAILVSLWRLHHRKTDVYTNFNMVHLIVNKQGYPDGAKCVELGTWLLMSWGFVVYVTAKALPEWYMHALLVFVLRGAYGAYLRSKGGDPMGEPGKSIETDTHIKTHEVVDQKGKKK